MELVYAEFDAFGFRSIKPKLLTQRREFHSLVTHQVGSNPNRSWKAFGFESVHWNHVAAIPSARFLAEFVDNDEDGFCETAFT